MPPQLCDGSTIIPTFVAAVVVSAIKNVELTKRLSGTSSCGLSWERAVKLLLLFICTDLIVLLFNLIV